MTARHTPVGHSPEDRDALLQTVALVDAWLDDDAEAIAALTNGLTGYELGGLVNGLATLLAAAAARDPELASSLLEDTRRANC